MSDTTEKPEPPGPNECCESGCGEACVWDIYYAELRKWQEAQQQEKASQIPEQNT